MINYSLLLSNIMTVLYTENDLYPGKGKVFYTKQYEKGEIKPEKEKVHKAINKTVGEGQPFLDRKEYERLLMIYDDRMPVNSGKRPLTITQSMFIASHLGGWTPISGWGAGLCTAAFAGKEERGTRTMRLDFLNNLSKWWYNADNDDPITAPSEEERHLSKKYKPMTEYIVCRNHDLLEKFCSGPRREHLKEIVNDFCEKMPGAKLQREDNGDETLSQESQAVFNSLCVNIKEIIARYDRSAEDGKNWLLARALTWLVIGATLRERLTEKVLKECLEPYLGSTSNVEESNENGRMNIDEELREKFDEVFSNTNDESKSDSSMPRSLQEIVNERRYNSWLERNIDIAHNIDMDQVDCKKVPDEGAYIVLNEIDNDAHTVLYGIFPVVNETNMTLTLTVEELKHSRRKLDTGEIQNILYFDKERLPDSLVMLTFHKGYVSINSAIFEADDREIKISKKPVIMTYSDFEGKMSKPGGIRNPDLFDINDLDYNKLENRKTITVPASIDTEYVIIDTVTGEMVRRTIEKDKDTGELTAWCTLQVYRRYLIMNAIPTSKESGHKGNPLKLTDLQMGRIYLKGCYNLQKDPVKAMGYFEKDGSGKAMIEIANFFKSDSIFKDQGLAEEYENKARELGYILQVDPEEKIDIDYDIQYYSAVVNDDETEE